MLDQLKIVFERKTLEFFRGCDNKCVAAKRQQNSTNTLNNPLDFKERLEVVDLPCDDREQHDGL